MSAVDADRANIERFVGAMFKHADQGTFASLRTFTHNAGDPPFDIKGVEINGSGLAALVQIAFGKASRAAAHEKPVVFAPPVCTLNNATRAREEDLANGLGLSVEIDADAKSGLALLRGLIGPPTVIVASGGEWTDPATGEVQPKLHGHWRLSEPTRAPEDHAKLKLARRLATALVGGDHTNIPVVHPIRWPGSVHRKGLPKLARIVEYHEDAEFDLSDALEALEAAAKARGIDVTASGTAGGAGDQRDTAALIAEILSARAYTAPLVALSARYAGGGMTRPKIVETLQGFMLAVPAATRDGGTLGRWQSRFDGIPRMAVTAVEKYGPKAEHVPNEPLGDVELDTSDDGLALEMGRKWGNARHVALFGRWLFFNGQRWEQDERLLHLTRTRDYLRSKGDELVRWAQKKVEAGEEDAKLVDGCEVLAKQMRSVTKVAAVAGLARSNLGQVATVGQWDADPWLLGTPAGTVDLRTGKLQPARLDYYITKQTSITPASPGTAAPIWQAFLDRIFRHAPELVPYMQRVAGYAATGLTTEHALVFAWGEGGNGKGVLFNTLAHVLGDYAKVAAPNLLLETQSDRHPTDMAMLMGARLVIASEVPPGRAWDEPKLKSLTGGDPITARYMRQDFFTFEPKFTLLVAGNHKPGFRSVDEAIRRRVQLVPFLQNIPKAERDPDLGEKLKAEAPAILRWVIDGCVTWQREGLNPPRTVLEASESYLEGEDILGQWLAERCDLSGSDITAFDTLFADWKTWGEANGGPAWGGKTFSKALDERGIQKARTATIRGFRGIKLREKSAEQAFKDAGRPGWGASL